MLMTKKELATVFGGLLMAGAVFGATDVVKQSFEAAEVGAGVSALAGAAWSGSGQVAEATYTPGGAGYVIQDADVTHAKVFSIDDSVMCTPTTALEAGKPALVDMMVQAMVPEDELAAPADADVQIAVGVDKGADGKGMLKVYCTPKGQATPAWCNLKEVEAGTWHRVTFVFNYATGYAQVRIDGEPIMTAAGSLTAEAAQTADGAWYKLAVAKTTLTSVEVVGTTGLDDLRIAGGDDAAEAAAVTGEKDGIPYAWFDKNGLAWDASKSYDASGLTLKAKYETGLSPFDGETFTLKGMTMADNKVVFAIPAMTPPPGYTVKLVYATAPDFSAGKGEAAVTAGATTVEVADLPDATVYYYRLEAVKAN